ncbi:helix-turn-helix transcriptional regulator [Mycobacterium paraterrae]|uniref:AAA family ATPase n=1 Tax=Mycobacterium paraterrae TaxID=577492 RepID=A0ABY3VTG2_9MYCO|nr:LuxR family transcriptional regulator [Mycobacterium paraterrae]UMB70794.1 AAA family ATPase [Mycobacterium paraterrae]
MAERVFGRKADEDALVDFLDTSRRDPRGLLIEGDPGMGKTTLFLDAVARAAERGFCMLATRAAAAESVLAYTALADLLHDVDDSLWADLPVPQRQGLDAALLRQRNDAQDADPRAVAAAFAAVITRLAEQAPVLIAIDDLQWLDISSANVVSYAARRLPDGVALMCTTRSEDAAIRIQLPNPDAIHRIRLQPLTVGELHKVFTLRLGHSFARPMLLRIHEIAGGNPFFALELARGIDTTRANALSLPSSLSDLVHSRINQAGAGAQDALLAMACLPDPTVQVVAQATDATPAEAIESLVRAEMQAVVVIDGNQLRFTHPILAHGVYATASPRRRRDMHRRLAELVTEPELRARHLALSDATGEPQTFESLDNAAEIACARGAPAAAAELLELAIALGGDSPQRRILVATHHFNAGEARRARTLLERAVESPMPADLRASALRLLGLWNLLDGSSREAADVLDRALSEVGDNPELRALILVPLSFALMNVGERDRAADNVDDAVTAAEAYNQSHLLSEALSMRAIVRFLLGRGVDEADMQRALGLEDSRTPVSAILRPRMQSAILLAGTGRLEQADLEMQAIRRGYVERGAESELTMLAFHRGLTVIWRGDFTEAELIADDAVERALQMGRDLPLSVALMLRALSAAYTGREHEARRDATQALEVGKRCDSPGLVTVWPITALGFLDVSLGNYDAALRTLEPLLRSFGEASEATEIFVAPFLPDAVEAMIGLGRFDDAEPLVDALEGNGRRLDRPWMLSTGARCRAMLQAGQGDRDAATATVERAMTQHARLPMPFERARTQLLLGQLQRRQRQWDVAAATLREAQQTFEQLGTRLWVERVAAELTRGGSGKRRTDGLTPAEQRIAKLAVTGMTNREIAAALFISPKTVEATLGRIYGKLNVRSRVDLHRVLGSENLG